MNRHWFRRGHGSQPCVRRLTRSQRRRRAVRRPFYPRRLAKASPPPTAPAVAVGSGLNGAGSVPLSLPACGRRSPAASRVLVAPARAQLPNVSYGEVVPRDVREMYDRGMQYLAGPDREGRLAGRRAGAGCTGLGLMVFLASGEDPNFGLYSPHVRRAVRNIISAQNAKTGYLGNSMYHHGFGMLGLAEAYGVVDERSCGPKEGAASIGQTLELAVWAAVTSQKKNPLGAWRYSPDANDADTSVSGAVLVGLLAARNAGLEVPDEAIDKAIRYYQQMTSKSGQVAYSGIGFDESIARIRSARWCMPSPAARTCRSTRQRRTTWGSTWSRRPAAGRSTPATIRPRPCFKPTPGLGEMEQGPDPAAEAGPAEQRQF